MDPSPAGRLPSPLPELDLARIRKYCAGRVPADVAHLVRLELDLAPGSVTIMECRPPWSPDIGPEWTRFPIARLRYNRTRREWTLYWRDRNMRFHRYEDAPPTRNISTLLDEIEADGSGIFWG